MVFVLGTFLNGEVKIYNQYILTGAPDLGTSIYTSREQCENEILKIAKTSAEYYGENQKLTYKEAVKPDYKEKNTKILVFRKNYTNGDFYETRCVEMRANWYFEDVFNNLKKNKP